MPSQATGHIKTTVGGNIWLARNARGLTQAQLAHQLNMESTNVSRWERGVVLPAMGSLILLGEALGKEPTWFYEDHGKVAA